MTGMARERVPPSRSTIATAVTLLAALLLVPLVLVPRAEAFIYWAGGDATAGNDAVVRANLDGTGVDQSFIRGLGLKDVAVDTSHVYWTGCEDLSCAREAIGRA
jgi:hypothetical protein